LGAGRLQAGVFFLAIAIVQGVPLSKVARPARHHSDAALKALARLHSVPGFLHGDLHLDNIIMLQAPDGQDTDIRCVILEFESSRFDASPAQQRKEQRRLGRLLNQ
jgi:hypothetical protein